MARPACGWVRWSISGQVWEVRVTLADGKRSRPIAMTGLPACTVDRRRPPRGCSCASCKLAQESGRAVSDRVRAGAAVDVATEEIANEWFSRYVKLHGELGNGVAQHPGDWRRWVAPTIGLKPLATVTPEDVKAIRDALTRARLDGRIRAKRAMNVWSTVVKAPFSRAWTDDDPKYGSLRVGPFRLNPATGIKPPVSVEDKEDDERERQALEVEEGAALLGCAAVPIETRRRYAWAMLTGLRPAELFGLAWTDVRDRVIKVQRGRDMKTGEDGDTKTRASVRDVPIHPHLAPLIAATRGAGRVFPVENVREVEKGARELRAHLLLAGVDRPELHAGTATLMPFDPRSLRTTFATWCARSGFDSAWIDAWLGHVPKTTAAKHYVKATGELGAGVFPRLPADLLGSSAVLQRSAAGPRKNRAERCEGRDLNPYRSYPTGT